MYEDAFSHLIPPVQYIAIFFLLELAKFFFTNALKSVKFLVFGLTAPVNEPIDTSNSFLTSITSVSLSSIILFHSL